MKNRSGSYKSIQLSIEDLEANSSIIKSQIKAIKELFETNQISAEEFTGLYLLLFLRIKHPKNYAQKNRSQPSPLNLRPLTEIAPALFQFSDFEKEKFKNVSIHDLFLNYNLKSFPQSINRAMVNWIEKKWDIVLSFDIPSPKTLLNLQSQNKRILTLIVDENKLIGHLFEKRDPLSFALHDLMHADQFFNNPFSQKGQLGFYKFMNENYHFEELQSLIKRESEFKTEFYYVVSDMNAYVIHLLKCLKSSFIKMNELELFKNFLLETKIPESIYHYILKLNNEVLTTDEETTLRIFFENYKEEV